MKTKIIKTESPFYGKYELNQLITFDYLGKEKKAIITKKARDFFKINHLRVNQEIEIVKSIKNKKVMYVITKIY